MTEFFPLLAKDVKPDMWMEWHVGDKRVAEKVYYVSLTENYHGLVVIETIHNEVSDGFSHALTVHWEYPDTIVMAAEGASDG